MFIIIIEVIDTFYDDYCYYNICQYIHLSYSYFITMEMFVIFFFFHFFISESHLDRRKVRWWKQSFMRHQLPSLNTPKDLSGIMHITQRCQSIKMEITYTTSTTNKVTLLRMPLPVQALMIAESRKCNKKSKYNAM